MLTRGLAADMAEEGGDLLHLHLLAAGGAETEGLVEGGGGDEGLVIPEADGMRHGGVALAEEVLELVHLEEVRDGLVAAVDAALALPPLVAHLRLRLGRLRLHHRHPGQQQHRRRRQRYRRHLLLPHPEGYGAQAGRLD